MEQITSQSGVINLVNTEIRKDGKPLATKEEVSKKNDFAVFASANIDCSVRPKVVVMDNSDSYDSASDLVKVKTLSNLTNETIVGVVETTINAGSTGYALAKGTVTDNNLTGGAVNQSVYVDATGILTLNPTDKKIGVLVTITSPIKVLINLGGEGSSSGSGSRTENFIPDYIANNAQINNYVGYNDGTAEPLDGTGGTSHITFTINNTLPLRASGDFKFSKPLGNRLGHGIAYEFAYPEYAKNQEAVVEFNYKTTGNYETGDIGIYIYDVTNSALYIPSAVLVTKSLTTAKFRAKFIGGSGDTYRLLFHVRTANSNTYDIQIDEVTVKRDSAPVGAAISDWNRYSGAFGSTFGSIANNNLFYSRSGENCKIKGSFRMGVDGGGTNVFIPLPPGLNINVDKVVSRVTKLGEATRVSVSNVWVSENGYAWDFCYDSALGSNVLRMSGTVLSGQYVQNSLGFSNEFFTVDIEVPIAGWSSNINLIQSQTEFAYNTSATTGADDTSAFGYGSEGVNFVAISKVGAGNDVRKRVRFQQPIQITDKLEFEINNGNGWQGIPYWNDAAKLIWTMIDDYTGASGNIYGVALKVINSTDVDVIFGGSGSGIYSSGSVAWSTLTSFKWRVRKSAGSAVGEVAPFVGARYTGHTGAAITANVTTVKYNTKDYDTHNGYNTSTGVYTIPISGFYRGVVVTAQSSGTATPNVFKNNASYSEGATTPGGSYRSIMPIEGYFIAGDDIDVRWDTSVTTGTSSNFFFAISKIG